MNLSLQPKLSRIRKITFIFIGFNPLVLTLAQIPPKNIASFPPLASNPDVSSEFGMRIDPFSGQWAEHRGIDLMAPFGAPIHATNSGVVSFSGYLPGYGNTVEIKHDQGISTRYGHAERILVKTGDSVIASQTIAYVGSSGRSTGPHLHFEVSQNSSPINPRWFLGDASAQSNNFPTLPSLREKTNRAQYTTPQISPIRFSKNNQNNLEEIRPHTIYLSNK